MTGADRLNQEQRFVGEELEDKQESDKQMAFQHKNMF